MALAVPSYVREGEWEDMIAWLSMSGEEELAAVLCLKESIRCDALTAKLEDAEYQAREVRFDADWNAKKIEELEAKIAELESR